MSGESQGPVTGPGRGAVAGAGRGARLGSWLLVLAAATAWALGLARSWELPSVAREARAMCEGLPDYADLARELPATARLIVLVDPREERAGERFACARLALAPRRVEGRRTDEPPIDPAAADAVLVDLGGEPELRRLRQRR